MKNKKAEQNANNRAYQLLSEKYPDIFPKLKKRHRILNPVKPLEPRSSIRVMKTFYSEKGLSDYLVKTMRMKDFEGFYFDVRFEYACRDVLDSGRIVPETFQVYHNKPNPDMKAECKAFQDWKSQIKQDEVNRKLNEEIDEFNSELIRKAMSEYRPYYKAAVKALKTGSEKELSEMIISLLQKRIQRLQNESLSNE